MDLEARSLFESGSGARRFRRISRRQASQLPRWCDIPAAWALKSTPFFLFPARRVIGIPILPIRLQFQDERPTSPISGASPRNSDGKALMSTAAISSNRPSTAKVEPPKPQTQAKHAAAPKASANAPASTQATSAAAHTRTGSATKGGRVNVKA